MPLSDRYMKYLQLLNVFELMQECRYCGRNTKQYPKDVIIGLIQEIDVEVVNKREQEIFGEATMKVNLATQKFDLAKIDKKGQFSVNYDFFRKHHFEMSENEQRENADEEMLRNSGCQKIFRSEPMKMLEISQLYNQMMAISKRAIKFQSKRIAQRYQFNSLNQPQKQKQTQKGYFLPAVNSKTHPFAGKTNEFKPDQQKIPLEVLSLTLRVLKVKVLKKNSYLLSLPRNSASPEQMINGIEILNQIKKMSISEKQTNAVEGVLTLLKNQDIIKISSLLNQFLALMTSQPAFCESIIAIEEVATIVKLLRYFSLQLFFDRLFKVRISLAAAKLLCLLRGHTVIWSPNTRKKTEVMEVHEQYLKILIYIERNLNRVDSSGQVALILQLISASIQIKKSLTEMMRNPGQLVGGDTNESYFAERFRNAKNDSNLKVNVKGQWELADLLELSPNHNLVKEIVQIILQQRSMKDSLFEVNNFNFICSFALNLFFLRKYTQIPQMCIEYTVIRLQTAVRDSFDLLSRKICSQLIKQLYTLNRIQDITESFVVKIFQDWSYHRCILSDKESSEETMVEVIKLLWVVFEYQVDSIIFSRPYALMTNKLAVEVGELLEKQESKKWLSSGTVSRLVIDKFKQVHKDFLGTQ